MVKRIHNIIKILYLLPNLSNVRFLSMNKFFYLSLNQMINLRIPLNCGRVHLLFQLYIIFTLH